MFIASNANLITRSFKNANAICCKIYPIEKEIINNVRDVSGSQPRLLTSFPFALILKYRPRATRLTVITLEENISNGFLPARSTIIAATPDITVYPKRHFK